MSILILILLFVLLLYVSRIGRWKFQWDHMAEYSPSLEGDTGISVIIAFRNERLNLGNLLESIQSQGYPAHLFEVILVDDNSDDGSEDLVKRFCKGSSNFKYVSNTGNTGKKAALRTGIRHSSNELIVITDADAIVPGTWLATVSSFFRENQPELMVGLTEISANRGFIGEFIEAEFISLIGSGAATALDGRPVYCSGANLAFTRSLYNELKDPLNEKIVSGDDTFMLHNAKVAGKKILVLKSRSALVRVGAPATLREFVNQHKRWVSKSRHYNDADIIYLALIVLITNLMVLISMILFMATGIWTFCLLWPVKIVADFLLMRSFYQYLGKKLSIVKFILFSLIYPFYVVIISLSGILSPYTWKGRAFSSRN